MLQKVFLLIMIVTILFQYSCEMKSENELYQNIMSIDKPQERINELEKFLAKYPENKKFKAYFGRICIGVIKSTIASKRVLSKREQRLIIDMLENMEEFLTEVTGDKPKKDK